MLFVLLNGSLLTYRQLRPFCVICFVSLVFQCLCKLFADDVKLYSSYSVNMTSQDLSVAIDRLLL